MATKTQIANMTMTRMGEALFTDVDSDGTNPANVFNAIWPIVIGESLNIGPELGWKFARRVSNCVQRQSSSITAFADYSGTVAGTVLATDASHPYISGEKVAISDGSTGSYDGDKVITKVDANSYYFTDTFVSTETATAKWTSDDFAYRFPRPTATRITKVMVGGTSLTDWVREGAYILTNQADTEVDMRYVLDEADTTVSNFPPHFIDVLWRKITVHLAYDLIQNKALGDGWLEEIERIYLPRAIGMDAREQYVQEESNSWVNAGRTTTILE